MHTIRVLIFFVFAFLFCRSVVGQYDYFVYEKGRFQSEMKVYVFAESSTLKERPDNASADVVALAHCDRVLILSNSMVESLNNGVIQYWYQAEYTNDSGKVFTGFIRGHDLAIGAVQFQIDYHRDFLLFQITGYNQAEAYTMTAKVVRNGVVLQTIRSPFIEFHLNPSQPDYSISVLKNIQPRIDDKSEVAEVSFFHERDDFPAGIAYYIWNGEYLARICETMIISEPLLFQYDSWVVYPGREGVKPGTVMMVELIKEFDETNEEYVVVSKIHTTYIWDGRNITVQSEE